MHQAQVALSLTSRQREWAAPSTGSRVRLCDASSHYGCWYHIQYVLKPFRTYWFINRRGQISLSLRLTDALTDTFGCWSQQWLSQRGVPAVCLRRGEGRGWEGMVMLAVGVWVRVGVGGGAALSKTKQGRGRKQFKSAYWSSTSDCTYIPQSHRSHSCVS